MREFLARLLLDRLLPQTCPYEDFFSAGPPAESPGLDTHSVEEPRTTAGRSVVRPHHAS